MPDDEKRLQYTFVLAKKAIFAGNSPFGAVLIGPDDDLLIEGTQLVESSGNWLAHAEMGVLQAAAVRWTRSDLAKATLYSSTEPCPMCTGAAAWSVNRLVFGLSQARMYALWPGTPRFVDPWDSRKLLDRVSPAMEVVGPLLDVEAARATRRQFSAGSQDKADRPENPSPPSLCRFWLPGRCLVPHRERR